MLIKGGLLFTLLAHEALAAPTVAATTAASTAEYPFLSANGFTSDVWVKALAKAQQVVGGLSLQEKLNFTDIRGINPTGCAAFTFPLPAAGIKEGLCYADGPTGLNSKYSTQWPNELAAAATWDRDLIYLRAAAEGAEFSRVGAAVPFSIVAGPVGRSVYDGRSWEGFGPDPFLAGEAVRATVRAFQDAGVTGLLKHFVGNEQEYLRYGSPGGYLRSNDSATIDDLIDPATLRELYTYAFAEGIREGAGGIMCSYNKLDGVYACESGSLLNDLLKTELNFHGAVITDFGAGRTTYGTAINGTDAIGGFAYMNLWGERLAPFIQNGSVPEVVLDDKLVRILTPFYALDQESLPEVDYDRWVANKTSAIVAREVIEGAITLLKNSNETGLGLPIKGVKDVALIGSAAAPGKYGILNNLGTFWYLNSSPFTGTISDGGGSGSSPAAYVVDPLAGFVKAGLEQERPVAIDGFYSDNPADGIVIGETGPVVPIDVKLEGAPVAIVHVAAVAEEGYDRVSLELLNNGSALINYVAARHNNTIVVIEAPGAVGMSQWYSHPNVTAILFSYFGGQEMGSAIANVAFGQVNPSGKLPFTIAKNVSDYPVNLYNGSIVANPISNFSEGVFIDYKYFDEKDIQPLYDFGYGLSYTTFSLSDASVWAKTGPCPAAVRETNEKLYIDGKLSDMGVYDYAATVQVTVTNTGKVDGAEVAQLYVTYPDGIARKMPVKSLRGFVKPYLKAGESQTVQFELRNKDLAYWSPIYHGWVVPRGDFTFHVGTSSRDLPHQLDFTF